MWTSITLLIFSALTAPTTPGGSAVVATQLALASVRMAVEGAVVEASGADPVRSAEPVLEDSSSTMDDGRGTPYIVSKSDNICGLDEPRQISKPAKVDYDALLEDTAEVRDIKRNGIDPNSSRGITLMTKARSRVLKACETARTEGSYDSIWKAITRRDKTAVPDATDAVKAKLSSSGD